jgi:C-terminal processing protease CtpA/Prc
LKGNYHLDQTPSPLRFAGKPVVLIDGNSFSATAEFAAVVYYHDRATFVGEETGGAYYGNNAGDALKLTLPHTRLRVHIPIRRYVMAVSDCAAPSRGILPDYEVTPTIEDILTGRDSVMAFAVSHITHLAN